MPEVNFTPVNQCRLDDPSDGAALFGTPAATPMSTSTSASTGSAGGGAPSGVTEREGGHGTDDLVRRFCGEGGATFVEMTPREPDCVAAELQALGTCGAGALVALETGGIAGVFAGIACAGALVNLAQCEQKPAQ